MVAIERKRQGEARTRSSGEIAPTECPSRVEPAVVWSVLSAGLAGFVGYVAGTVNGHHEAEQWSR